MSLDASNHRASLAVAGLFAGLPQVVYAALPEPPHHGKSSRGCPIQVGETFGMLRPLERNGSGKKTGVTYDCLCDPEVGGCGQRKTVSLSRLRDRSARSCGCGRRGQR